MSTHEFVYAICIVYIYLWLQLCYFYFYIKDGILLYSYFKDFNMLMLQMEIATDKNKAYCVFEKKCFFTQNLSMEW